MSTKSRRTGTAPLAQAGWGAVGWSGLRMFFVVPHEFLPPLVHHSFEGARIAREGCQNCDSPSGQGM